MRIKHRFSLNIRFLSILLTIFIFSHTALYAQNRLIIKLKPESIALSSKWQNLSLSLSDKFDAVIRPIFPSANNTISLNKDNFDRSLYQGVYLEDSSLVSELTNELVASGAVEWIEVDYPLQLFGVPNDPLFSFQWHHNNTGQQYYGIDRYNGSFNDTLVMKTGKSGADIGTVEARDKDGERVRPLVVIVDTGLDTDHPDIASNLWTNPDETPGNGLDDDHNGYVDDIHGWDFSGDTLQFFDLEGDNDPTDEHGHGTHVAGIACAVSDNNVGVAGVASNADILGLKMFPNAFTSVGMQAIMYGVDVGADVISMSWGNFYPSKGLQEILEYAHSYNVTLIAAIGNFGDSVKTYPAGFPTTITVGASNSDDETTYFSSHGSWMDLVAPGQDILSLRADTMDMYAANNEPEIRIIEEEYYLADGSSMSAPVVAGAAAEILSYSPGLSPDSVRTILTMSADDFVDPYNDGSVYPGHDAFSGWGRVNVKAALNLTSGRMAKIDSPRPRSLIEGLIAIYGSAYSQFGDDYELYINPIEDSLTPTMVSSGQANILHGEISQFNDWSDPGIYQIILRVGENKSVREVYYTSEPEIEITEPQPDDTVSGVLTFRGTVVAPDYVECFIQMYPVDQEHLTKTIIINSAYVADSTIGNFTLGQAQEGEYVFQIFLRTETELVMEEMNLYVSNGFAKGFPVQGRGLLNYGPAIYDITGNGYLETIVTSRWGISAINHLGKNVPGRWKWLPDENVDGPSAVYDINNDGYGEVAFISENQLNLLRFDGYQMPGYPITIPAKRGQNGYPAVFFVDMDNDGFMEIVYVSMEGDVFAYRHDGTSYFASLNGFFAEAPGFMVEVVPFVFCEDFNRDGQNEMIVMMSNAIYIFNTHNGIEPDWISQSLISDLTGITGACMADFDGDSLLELGFIGRESEDEIVYVAIMEPDGTYLDGFPKYLDRKDYLINYPAAADLDNDGKAEILFTISEVSFAEVWIVNSDGSTWGRSEVDVSDNYFATFPGTAAPPVVAEVTGDGVLDVIVRQGNFFPGRNTEKIYAFALSGEILDDWPLHTFTDANRVIYRLHTPSITNVGVDDDTLFADLLVTADDSLVYSWKLPVPYDSAMIAWGQFAHDSRNSGILPPTFGIEPPVISPDTISPPTPAGFYLAQNYPNPFNAETVIKFRLMRTSDVRLEVYNLLGQKIKTVIEKNLTPGAHRVVWDGSNDSGNDVASGVYFYRLKTSDGVLSRKMILMK
jgi:Subtilase family/FlgD Ig-like domain/FG-GAP-like repeat